MVIDDETKELFDIVKMKLGAPVRSVELTDDQLCACYKVALQNYEERVLNFTIETNWANFYGKSLSNIDVAYALSVRTLDMSKDYSYWFSKEVGLQQRGGFELKKDFFEIREGQQVYMVPAGREICKVMYVTPPTTGAAMLNGLAGNGYAMGGGVVAQTGWGAWGGAMGGYGGYGLMCLPMADVAYLSADLKYKQKMFGAELVYKVTAGPDGTHLVHLMSTPGSKFYFGSGVRNMFSLDQCYVWYTYYDVTPENADDCRRLNSDVILSPDQVPLSKLEYSMLNAPTKTIVRQLMVAEAAETLALVRGKFSGSIAFGGGSVSMDYNMLINMATRERDATYKALDDRLARMTPWAMMKNQADMTDDLLRIKKHKPLGMYVI